ncbi:SAM-dependent methyltransferase [Microvirga arsenatis]|uniref:Class I SAM-dependent methyltransferase n=1 Tax=Microvirga arsenatis TaxID=2692265 RepID=A0ABW9Z2F5_9HYPH|nr:class I SAM-dependent methyltransferase [Microvirga arsenatis]NBJ26518.1 class I SAM-dependent methyltransferase [Microvirga arsenatis]
MRPLKEALGEIIALEGPITVERYMSLCLRHYYATRDPLGAAGDFTTAPEISQMFGELIGLWMLEVWNGMGRPAPCRLVELGPGRGTLMADLVRATRLLPDFKAAASIHLVETSPALRQRQQAALAASGFSVEWHDRLEDVPPGPTLLVANEFFDALPVRQFLATERGWCERLVGLEGGSLIFGLRAEPEQALGTPLRPGDVLEWPAAAIDVMGTLAGRLTGQGGAALILDYGYWGPAFGDTLQALKGHKPVGPLDAPGDADLTTHVDFHRLARAALARGARVHGIATQGDFLQELGIEARAAALKTRATPTQGADIDAALARLTERGPKGMGELFKVLAVTHGSIQTAPGLPTLSPAP